MDVTSLYTNISQEEGIETLCVAYDRFYKTDIPIPIRLLERAPKANPARKLLPIQ